MRKLFRWSSVFGTLFVLLFMWLLGQIGVRFDFLNVFEEVFKSFDLTDIYYTKIRDASSVPYEDRIVLVNIGTLDRRGIAAEIKVLNKYDPKVIGIDAELFSRKEEDPLGDFMLSNAVKEANNFVFGSRVDGGNPATQLWDTLYLPPPLFTDSTGAQTGFVNIGNIAEEDFPTWKDIPPQEETKSGREELCFAAKVASFYNKENVEEFLERGNSKEKIFFKGNLDKYTKLDVEDVLDENFDSMLIKDKIVLMGYMGESFTNYHFDEDRFYTPLNPKLGRGSPDMYGVVVHANIISMILDKKFINEMPKSVSYLIAVLACYLNSIVFIYILTKHRLSIWYNGISKLIQLIETIVLTTIALFLFAIFQYEANLTLTLFVIILSGDLLEIFYDVIVKGIRKVAKK